MQESINANYILKRYQNRRIMERILEALNKPYCSMTFIDSVIVSILIMIALCLFWTGVGFYEGWKSTKK